MFAFAIDESLLQIIALIPFLLVRHRYPRSLSSVITKRMKRRTKLPKLLYDMNHETRDFASANVSALANYFVPGIVKSCLRIILCG